MSDLEGWQYEFAVPADLRVDLSLDQSIENSPPGKAQLILDATSSIIAGIQLTDVTGGGRTAPDREMSRAAVYWPIATADYSVTPVTNNGCGTADSTEVSFIPEQFRELGARWFRCNPSLQGTALDTQTRYEGEEADIDALMGALDAQTWLVKFSPGGNGLCTVWVLNSTPATVASPECDS